MAPSLAQRPGRGVISAAALPDAAVPCQRLLRRISQDPVCSFKSARRPRLTFVTSHVLAGALTFLQLISGPAEARRKFTFTLRRRADLVTMIMADLVKSCSLPSVPRGICSPHLVPSGGTAAASASEGIVT